MDKWLAIMIVGVILAGTIPSAVSSYSNSQVKIACYEAAKSNPNITAKDCNQE